jgi:hypothetical protein
MALVQSKSAIQATGAASQALAFNVNVTAGNFLVAVGGSSSAADTLAIAGWTALGAIQNAAATRIMRLFYLFNAPGGATTVTLTGLTGAASFLAIHEFSALNTADVSQSATGTANTQDSGGALTTQAAELLFGFAAGSPTSVSTFVQGAGWTLAETAIDNVNGLAFLTEYQNVVATGTYDATSTTTVGKGGGLNWGAEIATFYQTGGAIIHSLTTTGAGG